MSTEENPKGDAARNLRMAYENQQPSDSPYMTIGKQHVSEVLAYIAELESKVPAEPVRPFKVGDKVQEVTDDEDKPWGYVIEVRDNGCSVKLENTKYSGRRLLYFDNEIEPFVERPLFVAGQKVREISSGLVGSVLFEAEGKFEVMFQKNFGTISLPFGPDDLEAV